MNTNPTPCFPQFIRKVAAMGKRTPHASPAPQSPVDVEAQFKRFLPQGRPEFPLGGPRTRTRKYPLAMVFWCFVWQVLKPRTSCREVVRQIQARGETRTMKYDESTSGYCQARNRLPEETLIKAMKDSAAAADRLSLGSLPGWDRPIKVVDATSVTLLDTHANRKEYPYAPGQKTGCGFPKMKVLGLSSLSSGAILAVSSTGKHTHDVRMFRDIFGLLRPNDIILGDRGFCSYHAMAKLPMQNVDAVFRLHQRRILDKRYARRIGNSDWIATWSRPAQRPAYMDKEEWAELPEQIEVRIFRIRIRQKGFRTKVIWIATTLTDPATYPAEQIAHLYALRWDIELCFRHLKTTMGMDELRCRTPAMVRKELYAYLVAHNFIRCLVAEAASNHHVPRSRISFKGAVDAARCFHSAMHRTRSKQKFKQLHARLIEIMARELVPCRPGRREPRAIKRRPKPYPLLTQPRHIYREIPHRGRKRGAA